MNNTMNSFVRNVKGHLKGTVEWVYTLVSLEQHQWDSGWHALSSAVDCEF